MRSCRLIFCLGIVNDLCNFLPVLPCVDGGVQSDGEREWDDFAVEKHAAYLIRVIITGAVFNPGA